MPAAKSTSRLARVAPSRSSRPSRIACPSAGRSRASTTSGCGQSLELQPELHREVRGRACAVVRQSSRAPRRALERSRHRLDHARVLDLGEALRAARGGAARAPRTRRRPPASRRRGSRRPRRSRGPCARSPRRARGAVAQRAPPSPSHAPVDAPLVDREEEVLLRVEVRVHGALGEARLGRHRVDRRGVEALAREEALGGVDELVAGALLALRACHHRWHTASIQIPMVSVKAE